MKSGKCPKCGSNSIYKETNGIYIPKMLGTFVRTDQGNVGSSSEDYICAECCYYERYIMDKEKLKQVAKVWKKVG